MRASHLVMLPFTFPLPRALPPPPHCFSTSIGVLYFVFNGLLFLRTHFSLHLPSVQQILAYLKCYFDLFHACCYGWLCFILSILVTLCWSSTHLCECCICVRMLNCDASYALCLSYPSVHIISVLLPFTFPLPLALPPSISIVFCVWWIALPTHTFLTPCDYSSCTHVPRPILVCSKYWAIFNASLTCFLHVVIVIFPLRLTFDIPPLTFGFSDMSYANRWPRLLTTAAPENDGKRMFPVLSCAHGNHACISSRFTLHLSRLSHAPRCICCICARTHTCNDSSSSCPSYSCVHLISVMLPFAFPLPRTLPLPDRSSSFNFISCPMDCSKHTHIPRSIQANTWLSSMPVHALNVWCSSTDLWVCFFVQYPMRIDDSMFLANFGWNGISHEHQGNQVHLLDA